MFSGLSNSELTALEAMLEVQNISAGQVIIRQEEIGRSLYIISHGSVSITRTTPDGQLVQLAEVHRGEVFGELSALDAGPRSADATAIDDCELLILQREKFLTYVQDQPQAAVTLLVTLLSTLSQRLRRTDEIVYESEVTRLQKSSEQMQHALREMTEMNSAFQVSLRKTDETVYESEMTRLQDWSEQLQNTLGKMTEINSAFREDSSKRFEIIYAYRDLIINIERLSERANVLSRGSAVVVVSGMRDLA
ncbi:MAG: cyclic nucleotide-binding domain-containing protein, partial [SAR202 cluster bacterium]|nr:cyclic nucleotide-binding domain-containing protein [SAR202 cluster bacterium]